METRFDYLHELTESEEYALLERVEYYPKSEQLDGGYDKLEKTVEHLTLLLWPAIVHRYFLTGDENDEYPRLTAVRVDTSWLVQRNIRLMILSGYSLVHMTVEVGAHCAGSRVAWVTLGILVGRRARIMRSAKLFGRLLHEIPERCFLVHRTTIGVSD